MWLLDANMDVHLAALLAERGVRCDTATNRGWKALANGALVSAAVRAGFGCLLTREQLFGESASRALKLFPQFAVVIIDLPQKRWQQYRDLFAEAWTRAPIDPVPGRLVHWPVPEPPLRLL